jgi:hypothetical protein
MSRRRVVNSNTGITSYRNNYLSTVIKGSFREYDENRLTKIFCATFNHSTIFKKAFYKFIGISGNNNWLADDQYYRKTDKGNIIDIIIGEADRNGTIKRKKIIVENKVNCHLTKEQLNNYDRIQDIRNISQKHKIALVKNYFQHSIKNWKIKHWNNFYNGILVYENKKNVSQQPIDEFLIKNFLNYMKENNMDIVKSIDTNDLRLIYNIFDFKRARSIKQKQPFEIATNFINMLKGLIERTKENKIICDKIKKNFHFNPWIGSWYDLTDGKKEEWPCIVAKIRLRKAVNDIIRLETGLYFEKKRQKVYTYIWSSIVKKDAFYPNEKAFRTKILDYDYYCKETIKYWERKLKG